MSVVIESLPSTLVESKVEVIEIPEVIEIVEKKEEKVEAPKKRTRQEAAIEDITKLVTEVVGENKEIVEFVRANWKLGADKIVEMWFEQK